MPASTTHLNPWNPAHWVLLIRWFTREPARLKEYAAALDPVGKYRLEQAVIVTTGVVSFLPPLLLSLLLTLQPWFNTMTAGLGNILKWVGEHGYVLPLGLIALCLVVTVLSLYTGDFVIVWAAGLSILLGLVMIPVAVCLVILTFILIAGVSGGGIILDSQATVYALLLIIAVVIGLGVIYLWLKLIGLVIGLGRAAQLPEQRDDSRNEPWLGLGVWVVLSLFYGIALYFDIGPINHDAGLAGLAFGFLIAGDPLPLAMIAGLMSMAACTLFYQRHNLLPATMAVAIGFGSAILVGGTLGLTLLFLSQGLGAAFDQAIFLIAIAAIAIIPLILVYSIIYALIYRKVLKIVERQASSLVERYVRS